MKNDHFLISDIYFLVSDICLILHFFAIFFLKWLCHSAMAAQLLLPIMRERNTWFSFSSYAQGIPLCGKHRVGLGWFLQGSPPRFPHSISWSPLLHPIPFPARSPPPSLLLGVLAPFVTNEPHGMLSASSWALDLQEGSLCWRFPRPTSGPAAPFHCPFSGFLPPLSCLW